MSTPTVVLHRPPLPRIDLNPARRPDAEPTGADFSYSPAECARIWGLIRQSAEGVNQAGSTEQ